jgi:hypothetical protein
VVSIGYLHSFSESFRGESSRSGRGSPLVR